MGSRVTIYGRLLLKRVINYNVYIRDKTAVLEIVVWRNHKTKSIDLKFYEDDKNNTIKWKRNYIINL